jgi:hypothetical protein
MCRTVRSTYRSVVVLGLLLAAGTQSWAQKPPPMTRWEKFDFAKDELKVDEIEKLPALQLKYLRGIVFGRHGRVFKEAAIQNWLKTRPWYKPDPKYNVSVLNATERKNMDAIKEAEFRQHDHAEPGDLKFYREKAIKLSQLGEHSAIELRIMRAEVEAIHGKTFPDEAWLQAFFDERYWYKRNPAYDARDLNPNERTNIEVIAAAQKKRRSLALSPGDMGHFEETLITPQMLTGLSLHELRLLRNEVYARRGQKFRIQWITDAMFNIVPDYEPGKSVKEVPLSKTEQKNVATILKAEQQIHDDLSTKAISARVLKDLYFEDARNLRNEIYARHGKVFKSKRLNDYFTSFDWYKPDPGFDEGKLSAVEKRNLRTILAYERKATKEADAVAA